MFEDDFSPKFWKRYRELRSRFRAGTIVDQGEEHRELLALQEQIDAANVCRMEALSQLAQERGVTLPEAMRQLGIGPIQIPEE